MRGINLAVIATGVLLAGLASPHFLLKGGSQRWAGLSLLFAGCGLATIGASALREESIENVYEEAEESGGDQGKEAPKDTPADTVSSKPSTKAPRKKAWAFKKGFLGGSKEKKTKKPVAKAEPTQHLRVSRFYSRAACLLTHSPSAAGFGAET